MNFLFILNTFYPNIGGVENATLEICKRLKRESHNVYVLTTDVSNFFPNNEKLAFFEEVEGIQIFRVQFPLRFFSMPLKALLMAKKYQINYVYITDYWGVVALLLKRVFRIPFTYVLNGYNPLCPKGILVHEEICEGFGLIKCIKNCRQFSIRYILTLLITRLLLAKAKPVIAVSKSLRNVFISFFGKLSLKVLYYGVDTQKFRPYKDPSLNERYHLRDSDKIILFFGRLIKERAVLEFLPHFKKLLEQIDCKLIIIGVGPRISEIKRKIKILGIGKMVIFTGALRDQSLVSVINRANVVILPSLFPEPYPLVVLEAMACAKPIVGFRVGGVQESLEDNKTGFLVPPKDWTQFINKIHSLLSNEKLSSSIGIAARQKVERDSNWNEFMIKLLREIS